MSKGTLYFKTNVLLKNVIGKDLINDDNIAILELVKNSYDAGSKVVNIVFENIKQNDDQINIEQSENYSKITIQDFGCGMNIDDLTNKWLNIAFSDKKNKSNDIGRVFAGAKGIGRFSCDRLGEYLDLYTRKHNEQIIHLFIDWKKFEIDDKRDLTIQSIPVKFNTIDDVSFFEQTGYKLFENGTIIKISKLRNKWSVLSGKKNQYWDITNILSLRRSLEKLINPNQIFNKDKFVINIKAKEFIEDDDLINEENKKVNGEIKNLVFQKLNFATTFIESEIGEDGATISTVLKDKDREIFRLVEKNNEFPLLKNIKIVLYFLNQYGKIYFARETGFSSYEFGSIFLFINGFRIPPYGDKDDDWLKMETRKGQGYKRFLSARDLVGRIEVNDSIGTFKIISSREGIVKDAAFFQLTEENSGYFYKTLKRIEKYVVEGLGWDSIINEKMSEDEKKERKTFIREYEKKVFSPKWKYNRKNEIYGEETDQKDSRIIEILYSILSVKPVDVIELFVNTELMEQLAVEQTEKIKQILEDFNRYDPDILSRGTKNALKKIEDLLKKKTKELEDANIKTNELQKEVVTHTKKINELLTEIDSKAKSLEFEKKKNKFLLATSKNTTPEVLGMIHHVELETTEIDNQVIILVNKMKKGIHNEEILFKGLTNIKFHSDKILKISKLISHSNYEADSTEQNDDLVGYINEYLSLYKELVELPAQLENRAKISIENNVEKFIYLFSYIDISIVLDNLISNSNKALAKNIYIKLYTKDSSLYLIFSDDGKGVKDDICENIFDLGITSTRGSGIGLFTVRDILKKMGAEIHFVGNNQLMSGAQFEIKFNK